MVVKAVLIFGVVLGSVGLVVNMFGIAGGIFYKRGLLVVYAIFDVFMLIVSLVFLGLSCKSH